MTASVDNLAKSIRIAVIVSIISIITFICCAGLTGFRYETKKFKAFLTTLTLVFIYQVFFADVILMFLKATYNTVRLRSPWSGEVNPIFVGGPNRKKFLERRIDVLKSQLELGPTFYKRNEAMTYKYKEIFGDLILFGSYLAILLILIIGTRDPLAYYNTRTIKDVLRNPKFSQFAINNIITANDLYDFINGTIVDGFNDGSSYNGKPFGESGWMDLQIAKVLGVVRLRQIRHRSLNDMMHFETSPHAPHWLKGSPALPYKDKFWRIFQPWEYQDNMQTGGIDSTGKLYHHPGGGYVTLLGRNLINSHRVLDFLRNNTWIDSRTAVIIIEFTLYNVDADMFTLVMIFAEQTAFNSFVMTDKIDTLKLLFNIDNLPWHVLLMFLLYFLVLTRVVADVVLKMWYSPSVKSYLSMSWNYIDMTIVCLNVFIGIGVWMREVYVKRLLLQLETSKKNEFVSFHRAALIDETCTVLIAFLIALTTLRLWKILQFARVFRLLTSTLHRAKRPLASTTFFIVVFLAGIGLGSYIINGSNSPSFSEFVKSITTLMTLSFGFAATITPKELNYGGNVIGFMLYVVLVVAVTIFLLNMFITVLCLHFSNEKEEDLKRAENEDNYTFWHFLEMEIAERYRFISVFKKKEKTLASSKEEDVLRLRGGGGRFGKPKIIKTNGSEHTRRMELISDILETQMELLRESIGSDQEQEDDNEIIVHTNEAIVEDNRDVRVENKGKGENPKNLELHRKSENIVVEVHERPFSKAIRGL